MPAPEANLQNNSFSKFADAFLALYRAGNRLTVEDAIATFPEFETEIRERLPAMLMLEKTLVSKPELPSLSTGERVADCEIESEIGRGSYGVVYRGYQPELKRAVAIKAIQFAEPANTEAKRFELESRIAAQLNHPNIIPVYGFSRRNREAFLIMKLIEGVSFQQLLGESPDYRAQTLLNGLRSDWRKFAEVARDITSGLAHAHETNLVHRDIKPSNLMLDLNCHPWIADFGLAKLFDTTHSLSMTGDVVGTPRYMSPEQLRGNCDVRSDIYSLGLTLYELATGLQARDSGKFRSQEEFARAGQDLNEKAGFLPPDLQYVIQKACAYSPEDRYQTAAELATVLDRFASGRKADRRKLKRKPNAQFKKEYRLKLVGLTLASILVFGFGTFFLLSKASSDPQKPNADLIERLADDPENGLANFMKSTARDSILDATEDLGLDENEKNVLVSRFDNFVEKLDKNSDDQINEAQRKFRSSTLFDAVRVLFVNKVIEGSGLQDEGKKAAIDTLRSFGLLVARGDIDADEANRWIDSLSGGERLKPSELKQLRISDRELSAWVQELAQRVATFDVDAGDLQKEFESFFINLEASSSNPPSSRTTRQQSTDNRDVRGGVPPRDTRTRNTRTRNTRPRNQTYQISPAEIRQIEQAIQSLPLEQQPQAYEHLRRTLGGSSR